MSLYSLFNNIACVLLAIYNFLNYKRKKELLSQASHSAMNYFEGKKPRWLCNVLSSVVFWTILEIWIFSCVQYILVGYFNAIFGDLVNTGANYFGLMFFAPWMVVLLCVILRVDPLAQMDLIAPAYPLALVSVKIACFCAGCCRGVGWIYGFYNPISRLIEFPAQLLESLVALLLFIFLLICKNRFKKGTVFPIYLTVYSFIRFFTEFLRAEPEVFMGLKTYQILCIVGVAVGVLEYFAARKYDAYKQRKNTEPLAAEV